VTAQPANLAASVHQRLLNYAKAQEVDFNLLLARFAIERFLYRLAASPFNERFVLKGAMLLQMWLPEIGRPTRDLDLLGFGDLSSDHLRQVLAAICVQPAPDDGVHFLPDSVMVQTIREQDEYGGQRATLGGYLGQARLHVQIDVGIGDRLTPPAEWIEYPVLLDFPRPRLRAYRPETTIAEKLHAMVVLDLQNSRMKDFFDLFRLAQTHSFTGDSLVAAVTSTFSQRQTPIPQIPTAFTADFALHPAKARQWNAFCRRIGLAPEDMSLAAAVELIAQFLQPVIDAARSGSALPLVWSAGGSWTRT
jgi:hypothetical protein